MRNVRVILADAREQLAATPHFGAIAPSLGANEQLQRLSYVDALLVQLFELKDQVRGLGLGSSEYFPSETPGQWKGLNRLSGLDICQAWAVLLNSGHLFGTFATERGLLFQLGGSLQLRNTFLSEALCLGTGTPMEFQRECERRLDSGQLHSFHYLLALWRLRSGGISGLSEGMRRQCRQLISAFLSPPNHRLRNLGRVFRQVRLLCYSRIHGDLPGAKHRVDVLTPDDLRELFPIDVLPEAEPANQGRWNVLETIDRYEIDVHFTSPPAASLVLAHIDEFKNYWRYHEKAGSTFEARLDNLFRRPLDWPTSSTTADYEHFASLRVPSRIGCLSEVRQWLKTEAKSDPWTGCNFLISPHPLDDALRVDLYGDQRGFPSAAILQTVLQLSRAFAAPGASEQMLDLWRTSARFVATCFGSSLVRPHAIRLRPCAAANGGAGYACMGHNYEFARALVTSFLSTCSDLQRATELRQLLFVADKMTIESPVMVLLAGAEIVLPTETSTEPVSELDGLLGFFVGDRLHWLVIEAKKKNSQNGETQMQANLLPSLESEPGPIERSEVGEQSVWSISFEAPEYFRRDPASEKPG